MDRPHQPAMPEFELVRAPVRYFGFAAYIEAADGLVRIRTGRRVVVTAPISTVNGVRGSWWRPGSFSFEVEGRRYPLAASLRAGPDDLETHDLVAGDGNLLYLPLLWTLALPIAVLHLVQIRRRWVRILRGRLDIALLAERERLARQARARRWNRV